MAMRSQASEIKGKGTSGRSLFGSRRGAERKSALRRLALEGLEPRTLLATGPQALIAQTPLSNLPSPSVPQGNIPIDVSEPFGTNGPSSQTSNENTPSIAVDKNNPLKL